MNFAVQETITKDLFGICNPEGGHYDILAQNTALLMSESDAVLNVEKLSQKILRFLLAKSKFINNIPDVTFEDSFLSLKHIKEECKKYCFCNLVEQTIKSLLHCVKEGPMQCQYGLPAGYAQPVSAGNR